MNRHLTFPIQATIYILLLILSPFISGAQYCTPSYTSAQCNAGLEMWINNFSTTGGITNITKNNSGCGSSSNSYIYYSKDKHAGIQGTKVNFSVTIGTRYNLGVKIWVDFNGDGDFKDANENVYKPTAIQQKGQTAKGSFTIPITAKPGETRMRVRCGYNSTSFAQCGSHNYGEAEDYLFVIIPACSTDFNKPIDPLSYACAKAPGGSITVNDDNGASYQWQMLQTGSFVNLQNGAMFSDVDQKKLLIDNIPASMAGTQFRCMVTPTCGASGTTPSDTVALNIRPDVRLVSQRLTDTSCIGLTTILSYEADDHITESRWQINTGIPGEYVDLGGTNYIPSDDSLMITNIPDTLNGAKIRCVFKGICGIDTIKDITLSVNPIPKIINQPVDTTVKPLASLTFQVECIGVGIKYRWQAGVNDKFVNINNNGIYSGVRTDRLLISGISRAQDQMQFRCIISGAGSCADYPDTSNFAVLGVDPLLSVNEITNNSSITLYPNPASANEVTIKTDGNTSLSGYRLTDKQGRVMKSGIIKNINSNLTTIDISKLPADMYFIQILNKDNATVQSMKFIKL